MDQNEKVANDKMSKLESEIKVLKNEVQAVLLDLRESYLNMENPFHAAASPAAVQPIVITERAPVQESRPESSPRERAKPDNPASNNPSPAASFKPEDLETGEDSASECLPIQGQEAESVCEGTKMASGICSEAGKGKAKTPSGAGKKLKPDLVTMAGLTSWVEHSCQKIGKERTEAVLDISETMGCFPPELRPILVKLINLAPQNAVESPVRARDYIDSLIKLNSLLGKDNREENGLLLLSLVSGETNHG